MPTYVLITYISAVSLLLILLIAFIVLKKSKLKSLISKALYFVFIIILIEIFSTLGFYIRKKRWTFKEDKNYNTVLFEKHPNLIGVPKKNVNFTNKNLKFTHNSLGFRGKEVEKTKEKQRIICIGGSTTYGIGVSDNQTWPYYLDSLLNDSFEVINYGIPGHSTSEHIILIALKIWDLNPDYVVIHAGLNDLRNMNTTNLQTDYSNYHSPTLFGSFGFCYENELPHFGIIRFTVAVMQKLNLYPKCYYYDKSNGYSSQEIDKKAFNIYKQNLETIISMLKERSIKIVFVPQIINEKQVLQGKYHWWIPYLKPEKIIEYLKLYNKTQFEISENQQTTYVSKIDSTKWQSSDFVDVSHLNSNGNYRFAEIISRYFK